MSETSDLRVTVLRDNLAPKGLKAGHGLALLVEWLSVARERGCRLSYESVPPQILAVAHTSGLKELMLVQPG